MLAYIFRINKIRLPNNPYLCILGCESLHPTPSSAGSLSLTQWTHITLLLARRMIMFHWIKPTPISLPALEYSMLMLFNLERLDTIVLNFRSTTHFFARWRNYMEATFTQKELLDIMQPFKFTDWYLKQDLSNSPGKLKISNLSDPSIFIPP